MGMKTYIFTNQGFSSEEHFLDSSLFKDWESIEALIKVKKITKINNIWSGESWFYTDQWRPAGSFGHAGWCLHNMIIDQYD
jgi:hypothetical protein